MIAALAWAVEYHRPAAVNPAGAEHAGDGVGENVGQAHARVGDAHEGAFLLGSAPACEDAEDGGQDEASQHALEHAKGQDEPVLHPVSNKEADIGLKPFKISIRYVPGHERHRQTGYGHERHPGEQRRPGPVFVRHVAPRNLGHRRPIEEPAQQIGLRRLAPAELSLERGIMQGLKSAKFLNCFTRYSWDRVGLTSTCDVPLMLVVLSLVPVMQTMAMDKLKRKKNKWKMATKQRRARDRRQDHNSGGRTTSPLKPIFNDWICSCYPS